MKKPIFIIIAVVCVFCAAFCLYQANICEGKASNAISQQAYDIKAYGWEAANSSYYSTYERYANQAKSYKIGAGVAAVLCVGSLIVYFVPIGSAGKKKKA